MSIKVLIFNVNCDGLLNNSIRHVNRSRWDDKRIHYSASLLPRLPFFYSYINFDYSFQFATLENDYDIYFYTIIASGIFEDVESYLIFNAIDRYFFMKRSPFQRTRVQVIIFPNLDETCAWSIEY